MAKGDYSVQFTSMEYQEIAQLSDTLNYLKDEIKKSDDFQKELLANVSHDFKTPLTMIKAYASMVKEISGNDPEKRDKHLQVIIDESDRLTGLVNDVLSASKISAGLEQLNKKVFNLTEYLYSIINKFDYLQETQGYKIIVDIDPNLYTLADEEKIGQVIYNLLSNAINYTGEDKKIYISLKDSPQDNRIKFAVRDTGKGISEDELKNIWDRYYRSTDAHLRPVKGTGLGLNIVKVILQSHAFDFGVNSKLDEGSTFYVDFPAVSSKPDDESNA
jgi:signal transduction histidine kinase